MSSVKIELDLTIVQEAIKTHTCAAVAELLDKHYDIKAMIKEQLLKDKPENNSGMYGELMTMRYVLASHLAEPTGKSLIEGLINSAIRQLADDYVKSHVQNQKKELYAAFKKMMISGNNKFVKAFGTAIDDAVRSNWSFQIDTKMRVKDQERDDY